MSSFRSSATWWLVLLRVRPKIIQSIQADSSPRRKPGSSSDFEGLDSGFRRNDGTASRECCGIHELQYIFCDGPLALVGQ